MKLEEFEAWANVPGREVFTRDSDEIAEMIEKLRMIREVATGERQVADDDTGGMAWIAEFI